MPRPAQVQHRIKYGTLFIFCFKVCKQDVDKVKKLLNLNATVYECVPTVFDGYFDFELKNFNIRKAQVVRVLLKNVIIYE